MVMSLLASVAALYILCITADMLAMERHNIKMDRFNDNYPEDIHNSVVSTVTYPEDIHNSVVCTT